MFRIRDRLALINEIVTQDVEVGGTLETEGTDNIVMREDPGPVLNSRPKRDRKQNVRYSSQEYDLTSLSITPGKARFTLSRISIQPKSGKLLKKMIKRKM